MYCVIGSHAINRQLFKKIGKLYREPKDLDMVCDTVNAERFAGENYTTIHEKYLTPKGGKMVIKGSEAKHARSAICEIELTDVNETSKALYDLILADPETIVEGEFAYASLNVCLMLKMSHRYLKNNPHFLKTMRDIHNLRAMGATVPKKFKKFYKLRETATYWYKHPKLKNSSKDAFFTGDGVTYKFAHDDLHIAVAHPLEPAYKSYQHGQAEVDCSKELFYATTHETRLRGVIEEVYVLALERSQIAFGFAHDPAGSFNMALEKVCTSITSGWFREFAYDHYFEVRKMYDSGYVNKFKLLVEHELITELDTTTSDQFFEDIRDDKIDMAKQIV